MTDFLCRYIYLLKSSSLKSLEKVSANRPTGQQNDAQIRFVETAQNSALTSNVGKQRMNELRPDIGSDMKIYNHKEINRTFILNGCLINYNEPYAYAHIP